MIQIVDIIQLAIEALIVALRKTYVLALLRCFAYPFVQLNNTLHDTHEAYAQDYLNWNSQLCRLEGMLNAKFNNDPADYEITIDDGNRDSGIYLLDDVDHDPLYLLDDSDSAPVFLLDDADFLGDTYDFLVQLPAGLGLPANDPRIIQQLNRYKLAGKQYKIILT